MTENPYLERDASARLAGRLERLREDIADACLRAGRKPEEVTLMGVTKTVSAADINEAIRLGLDCIGENRVQEYLGKRDALRLSGAAVHLIGHLQTNKAAQITGRVDMIESIDSLRIAAAVNRAAEKARIRQKILAEVNIGGEAAKHGIPPEEAAGFVDALAEFPHLELCGLMTVPPVLDTEREQRRVFSKMYKLFVDIRDKNRHNSSMYILSMGMSADFREAVLEGSTLVRVGSALFGKREL